MHLGNPITSANAIFRNVALPPLIQEASLYYESIGMWKTLGYKEYKLCSGEKPCPGDFKSGVPLAVEIRRIHENLDQSTLRIELKGNLTVSVGGRVKLNIRFPGMTIW